MQKVLVSIWLIDGYDQARSHGGIRGQRPLTFVLPRKFCF